VVQGDGELGGGGVWNGWGAAGLLVEYPHGAMSNGREIYHIYKES